jgi:acetyl-CoA acetyltransferase
MAVPVILAAIRTPFGKRGGAFRDTRPDALLAHALKGVVARAGVDPARVEDVVCGTVTQVGEQGANIGRLGVLLAGLPIEVPAVTLNRMCGSSQQAVHFAAQAIAAGDARYAIGCGVENMTRVRMFSDIDPDGRHGGFGGLNPELLARHELIHQGESAERVAERWQLSRQALDEFAIESHAVRGAAGNGREILATRASTKPARLLRPPGRGRARAVDRRRWPAQDCLPRDRRCDHGRQREPDLDGAPSSSARTPPAPMA